MTFSFSLMLRLRPPFSLSLSPRLSFSYDWSIVDECAFSLLLFFVCNERRVDHFFVSNQSCKKILLIANVNDDDDDADDDDEDADELESRSS